MTSPIPFVLGHVQACPWSAALLLIAALVAVWVVVNWKQLSLEFAFLLPLLKVKRAVKVALKSQLTVGDWFESRVDVLKDSPAIFFEDQVVKYSELESWSNRIAHYARENVGLRLGDTVALCMTNRPAFVATWLGLAKLGVRVALINTNLRGIPLLHSLNAAHAKLIIVGGELASVLETIDTAKLEEQPDIVFYGHPDSRKVSYSVIDDEVEDADDSRYAKSEVRASLAPSDVLLYIYTSGTTGLPKAAKFNHMRFFLAGQVWEKIYKINTNDRIYTTLPLYHSAGGVIGIATSWQAGCAVVLRAKFSASQFWTDCDKFGCTVVQYIGELCRYLCSQPVRDTDTRHKVRLAIGNGMRPDVWKQFIDRFAVPEVGEFYGATEGNCTLFNNRNVVGAVGMLPIIFKKLYPVALVEFDVVEEAPVRGANGLCIPCPTGKPGELLGLIQASDPLRRFDGYENKAASEKKIIRDVFKNGDMYFRTGDLLRQDETGMVFFVDRIGDTFRWKGENVSTNEVAEVINQFDGVAEANVYGVKVGALDGRAGMVSLVAEGKKLDTKKFFKYLSDNLPSYARPIFIRLTHAMEVTSTMKHRKVELVKQGFDPSLVDEPLLFADTKAGDYIPLTADVHDAIIAGEVRV